MNEPHPPSLTELQNEIMAFRDARNWEQFHTLKDLLLGLQIEVGELSELFLWKNASEIAELDRTDIADELADVFAFVTYLARHFEIDLSQAVREKLAKNQRKYPVEKSYNSAKKYTEI